MLLQYFSIAEVYLEGGQSPPPPEFDRSVKPIQTRVADYAPYYCQPPPLIQKAIYTSDSEGVAARHHISLIYFIDEFSIFVIKIIRNHLSFLIFAIQT